MAREWLRMRFGDDEQLPDEAAIRHLVRILDGAEAPEQFDVMPESAGLYAVVEGWTAENLDEAVMSARAAALCDSLLAALRHRVSLGEPLQTDPFADRDSGLPDRHQLLSRPRSRGHVALARRKRGGRGGRSDSGLRGGVRGPHCSRAPTPLTRPFGPPSPRKRGEGELEADL